MGLFSKIKNKVKNNKTNETQERTFLNDYDDGIITWEEAVYKACSMLAATFYFFIKQRQVVKWDLFNHQNEERKWNNNAIQEYIQAKKDGYMYNANAGKNMTGEDLESEFRSIEHLVEMDNDVNHIIGLVHDVSENLALRGTIELAAYMRLLQKKGEEFNPETLLRRIHEAINKGYFKDNDYKYEQFFYDPPTHVENAPFLIYDACEHYPTFKRYAEPYVLKHRCDCDSAAAGHTKITPRYFYAVLKMIIVFYDPYKDEPFIKWDTVIDSHGVIHDRNGNPLEEDIVAQWDPLDDQGIMGENYVPPCSATYDPKYAKYIQSFKKQRES